MSRDFTVLILAFATVHITLSATLNFQHNPNCLLMITQVPSSSSLSIQHEHYLSSAHQGGFEVKTLNFNDPRSFLRWKMCCYEIVLFYDGGDIKLFNDTFTDWGYHNNVMLYFVFSTRGYHIWNIDNNYFAYFLHFSVPIYVIIMDFKKNIISTALINPTNESSWKIVLPNEDINGNMSHMFPSGEVLTKSRLLFDNNQNQFRLPMYSNWERQMKGKDCENPRIFLSESSGCHNAFGGLHILQRRLNITYSSIG